MGSLKHWRVSRMKEHSKQRLRVFWRQGTMECAPVLEGTVSQLAFLDFVLRDWDIPRVLICSDMPFR